MRLVNETTLENWQVGRLEVFFEGSWSQVCRGAFDGADADVACRQLGYGSGTVFASGTAGVAARSVFPEVAVTLPGCTGAEASLLDCGPEPEVPGGRNRPRACFDGFDKGVVLACVAQAITGLSPRWCFCQALCPPEPECNHGNSLRHRTMCHLRLARFQDQICSVLACVMITTESNRAGCSTFSYLTAYILHSRKLVNSPPDACWEDRCRQPMEIL